MSIEIDWSYAPEFAGWLSTNADGEGTWWQKEPVWNPGQQEWIATAKGATSPVIRVSSLKKNFLYCRYPDSVGRSAATLSYSVGEYSYGEDVREDVVNAPNHYRAFSVETIEMMRRIWGSEKFIAHCEMTAFKYRMRAGRKSGNGQDQDLAKATKYEEWAKEESAKLQQSMVKPSQA